MSEEVRTPMPRPRAVALTCLVLFIAAAIASGPVLKDLLLERLAIRKLSSEVHDDREFGLTWLARKGSVRAIRPLLDRLRNAGDPDSHPCFVPLERCIERSGRRAIPPLESFLRDSGGAITLGAGQALWDLEPGNRRAVEAFSRALGDSEPSVRKAALEFLEDHGQDSVTGLRRALEQPEPEVRAWACATLGEIGPQAEAAAPGLRGLLADPAVEVRVEAAQALFQIGEENRVILPALIEGLGAGGKLRLASAWVIERMGPEAREAIPALLVCLGDPGREQNGVCRALAAMGPAVVPGLTPLLDDRSLTGRRGAFMVIMMLGEGGRAALPALRAALTDREVADLAARALAALRDEESIPAILKALELQRGGMNRMDMVRALGSFGPRARNAVPQLARALRSELPGERVAAAEALGNIGAGAGVSVLALAELLLVAGQDAWESDPFTDALLKVGGTSLVPNLIQALQHDHPGVRMAAAQALEKLGREAKDAIPALLDLLSDPRTSVFLHAAGALASIDPPRRALLVPSVLEALKTNGGGHAGLALRVLGGIGPEASPAVPTLLDLALEAEISGVRTLAAVALGKIGLGDLTPLTALFKDGAVESRRRAAFALQNMGMAVRPAVPLLIEALKDRDRVVRAHAAKALAAFVAGDSGAREALREALRDRSREVRRIAGDALKGPGERRGP